MRTSAFVGLVDEPAFGAAVRDYLARRVYDRFNAPADAGTELTR